MWLPARQTIAPKTPGPSTEVLEFGNNSFSPRFEAFVGGSLCRIGDGGPSLESIGVTHPEVWGLSSSRDRSISFELLLS